MMCTNRQWPCRWCESYNPYKQVYLRTLRVFSFCLSSVLLQLRERERERVLCIISLMGSTTWKEMKIRKVWGSVNTIKAATSTPHIMIIPGNRTLLFNNKMNPTLYNYYLVKIKKSSCRVPLDCVICWGYLFLSFFSQRIKWFFSIPSSIT